MDILVHIGLNKCGSTHIQASLDSARDALCASGVWYPQEPGRACHYGLSRSFGFGPDAGEVAPRTLPDLIAEADLMGCSRMILSSEYLSLYSPAGAVGFVRAIARAGARVRVVMFSRELVGWVRSLFNQYVRTVDGARYLPDINAYLDQVLANGAVRVADRAQQWRNLLPPEAFHHYRLDRGSHALAPFEAFAGIGVPAAPAEQGNASVPAAVLHRIGLLHQRAPRKSRDAEICGLLSGRIKPPPAPADYLEISPGHMARFRAEVIEPFDALPVELLPERASAMAVARVRGQSGFPFDLISDSNFRNGGLNERAAVCGDRCFVAAA